jgi:hypothetical protein
MGQLTGVFVLQAAFHGLLLRAGKVLHGSAVAQVGELPVFSGEMGTAPAKEPVQPKLEAFAGSGLPVLAFGADRCGLLT